MNAAPLRARCLCGGVGYRYSGPVDAIMLCLCHQCRQANGSVMTPVLRANRADVAFDDTPTIAEFESSPGKFRAFCTGCGAPVYSRRDDLPETLRLRIGLIADLPEPAQIDRQHREAAWPWLSRLAEAVA